MLVMANVLVMFCFENLNGCIELLYRANVFYLNTTSECPKLNPQEFKNTPFVRPVHLRVMGELLCFNNGKFISVQFYLLRWDIERDLCQALLP